MTLYRRRTLYGAACIGIAFLAGFAAFSESEWRGLIAFYDVLWAALLAYHAGTFR